MEHNGEQLVHQRIWPRQRRTNAARHGDDRPVGIPGARSHAAVSFAHSIIAATDAPRSTLPEPDRARRAHAGMNGPLEWIAAIGTMIAAGLIAADLGRRVTGWGFVLFCAVAVTWIVSGLSSDALPIAAMNGILLVINAWGVWQFLLSPKNKAKLEKLEALQEEAEAEAG